MLLDFIDAIYLVKSAIVAVCRNQVTQLARKNWLALKSAHMSHYETSKTKNRMYFITQYIHFNSKANIFISRGVFKSDEYALLTRKC